MDKLNKMPILSCTCIFFICAVVRIAEYFFIRTDETIISENFIHKVFGIVLLIVLMLAFQIKGRDIGIKRNKVIKNLGKGLLLGTACFAVAYAIECLILYIMNQDVKLSFYVSGFSLDNDMQIQTGGLFILLCVIFNIINVLMEEGVFRGLFTGILEQKSFVKNCAVVAFFFGIWHLVMPFRDYLDGKTGLANLLVMGIGYIILAGIMSIKWSLLYRITGSLWMGMGDHLFNNLIVTNMLHVISVGEADSMQIVRIMTGQLLSFVFVYLYYKKAKVKEAL